jgi:hypothetical protein
VGVMMDMWLCEGAMLRERIPRVMVQQTLYNKLDFDYLHRQLELP